MRLRRLALRDWRGIECCELRFSDGVTIVEGPNEAGKSTLVEALRTLVKVRDDSKKQAIRAIMPAGRDVGSRVEAEIETGPYHFVYSKTYNKSPQTTLEVRAPRREQLSGREAHERVEQILDETVDQALWEALLIEQGASLSPADLKSSGSLSQALDEAAGTSQAGGEDVDLLEAAQAEYGRYWSLKAGKARFADLERAHADAKAACEKARAALAEVERDVESFDRLQADVRRREQAMPALRAAVDKHAQAKQDVDRLRGELELKARDLAAAKERKAAAERALEERRTIAAAITDDEKTRAERKAALEPLAARMAELAGQVEAARRTVERSRTARAAARERLDRVRADAEHVGERERLEDDERRLREHAEVSARVKAAAETLHAIAVDDRGLESIRAADRRLEIAREKRDLAATTVTVTAETTLDLSIEGAPLSLGEGEAERRTVASGLSIRMPGVATIEVTPPRTAAELDAELEEAGTELRRALERSGVPSLDEAVRQNENRRNAKAELERWQARAAEILAGRTAEELAEAVRSGRRRLAAFLEARRGDEALPDDGAAARAALADAEALSKRAETAYEEACERESAAAGAHVEAEKVYRKANEGLIALDATLADKRERLERARAEASDEALDAKAREAGWALDALERESATLGARLEALAPDTVETLHVNASETLARAERDLTAARQNLAVIEDRLQRAQADGRFEALETAERSVEETGSELEGVRRRAAAAERLWRTLNHHRDAARRAYVQPLKEAVERLGRIVFGAGFEVAIGEDWTLESCTRDGTVLPFESLSVGAREQLGILARLAAARIVAPQGGVPLIIDDALGFSDPARLETMGAAISAAGRECQIVILTCTPGRFTHVGSADVVRFGGQFT